MTTHHGVENPENVQANRTPEQIQRELGNTRARIDDGLDELDHRLGTGEAIKEAAYHVRDGAAEFSASVGRVIRDNPVPAFLIGAGAAWIAMSALARTERGQDMRHRVGERARGVAHDASDRADDLRHRADAFRQRAGETVEQARQRALDAGHRVREGAGQVAHKASDAFESQPLLIGALGLAVGAAIGASIPATRREDAVVGPVRDRLKDEAIDYGREQVARASDAAHEAIEGAREETRKAMKDVNAESGKTDGASGNKNGAAKTG